MEITPAQVKALRDATGAGMMDCKQALQDADGDVERAKQILREAGKAGIEKRASRSTTQGVIDAYLHTPDPNLPPKLGVLVELDCETDFVAKTDQFQRLAHEIALHVAVADPAYLRREDVPDHVVEKEREIYRTQMADQKKPAQVLDKIVEGKLEKFFAEQCLLEQTFIKDTSGKTKVKDLVDLTNSKTGERIVVKRFARFKVGEGA